MAGAIVAGPAGSRRSRSSSRTRKPSTMAAEYGVSTLSAMGQVSIALSLHDWRPSRRFRRWVRLHWGIRRHPIQLRTPPILSVWETEFEPLLQKGRLDFRQAD